jgi:hypothetical protein
MTRDYDPKKRPAPAADQGDSGPGGLSPMAVRNLRLRRTVHAANAFNESHPDLVAEFLKLTGVQRTFQSVKAWQLSHGLKADGKIGPDTVQAARSESGSPDGAGAQGTESATAGADSSSGKHPIKPTAERMTFSDEEAGSIDLDAGGVQAADAGGDVDAASVVGGGDTSSNRHEKEGIEGEDVEEVASFILETLDAAGVKHVGKAEFVRKLAHVRSAHDVYQVLKSEITPEAFVEVCGKIAKHYAWKGVEELAESIGPAVAGASVGLEFAQLSMKLIIGPANEEGRQRGQLNRYAAAWAFRFLDDGYAPAMLAEVDEQTSLMNTCTRLGIEDAIKTLEKLGAGAPDMRRRLISHYGSPSVARENLVLELLKQAGAA